MAVFSQTLAWMLVLLAVIGPLLYVALVVAIPVCRLIDWLAGEEPKAA